MTDPIVHDDDDDNDNIFSEFNSDLDRLDSEAEAILNSIRNEQVSETRSRSESSDVCSEDASGHDDDMHDDDEMNDEILRLGSVVASLQHDLDNMSVATVTSTVSTSLDTPAGSPPHESFARVDIMEFIQLKRLYGLGIGGQETNIPLIVVNVLVWAVVIVLVIHVKHGALNEQGCLAFLPTFGAD